MTFRHRLIFACLVSLLAFLPARMTAANENRPPNFVVFLVDDLGYMDIGAYNPDCFYDTPNVDRLAASGMKFTDGYAANPVCSPTRYSLMTGKWPTRAKATNYFAGKRAGKFLPAELIDRLPLEEVTIAEALKKKDYATFYAGKWHLGPTEEFWPEKQGFDVNAGGHDRGGPYGGKKYFSPYGNPRLKDGPDGEHLPDRLADETIQFMQQNKDQPFLAYLSFYSVHTPLIAREDLRQKYAEKAKQLNIPNNERFAQESKWPGYEKQPIRVRQDHAIYAGMVEAMDLAVGKVLEALEEQGLADNTIVFFTSDNGGLSTSEGSPTSNKPLRGGKGWVYEGGIREPLIVRWPGHTKPGSVCEAPVASMDFYPTILQLAGAQPQPGQQIDGESLVPLLDGKEPSERALYWHYPHYSNQQGFPGGAIRQGDWKLVENYENGEVQLFNLRDDMGEQHNLAGEQPDRVAKLRTKLHDWYQEVDAEFLQAKPNGPPAWKPGE
ncbi:MAG: sulfatase [Pirellulales bacterium]